MVWMESKRHEEQRIMSFPSIFSTSENFLKQSAMGMGRDSTRAPSTNSGSSQSFKSWLMSEARTTSFQSTAMKGSLRRNVKALSLA